MRHLLSRLFGLPARPGDTGALRLSSPAFPGAIYAVGDVHGRLDLLLALEDEIARHARKIEGEIWVVMLGDYVDRGPSSAQVLDHLIEKPPAGFRRICLGGNHEQAMADAFETSDTFAWWCKFGGLETLASYGISVSQIDASGRNWETTRNILAAYVPDAHRQFLASLPVMLEVPDYVFVHAGLRPGVALRDQIDDDMRWIGEPFTSSQARFGVTVVHGHSIVPQVLIGSERIAVDTGAYQTGRLSAVCLVSGREPIVIDTLGSRGNR